ncbi:MAG: hypothetical protein AAGA48_41275, partial [Myxococcota bacterium]
MSADVGDDMWQSVGFVWLMMGTMHAQAADDDRVLFQPLSDTRRPSRSQSIERLKQLLARDPPAAVRVEMLFRLAELYFQQSRMASLREHEAWERRLDGCFDP